MLSFTDKLFTMLSFTDKLFTMLSFSIIFLPGCHIPLYNCSFYHAISQSYAFYHAVIFFTILSYQTTIQYIIMLLFNAVCIDHNIILCVCISMCFVSIFYLLMLHSN
jgi:hypothetical protein